MLYVILFLVSAYISFLILLLTGWRKVMATRKAEHPELFLSVIIPFRNEALCIRDLVEDLKHQQHTNFEVWMVDDHSTDDSVAIISNMIPNDIRFKVLPSGGTGKKQAITFGVQHAKGSVIVTTDADCRVSTQWLSSVSKQFYDAEVMMVSGGVAIIEDATYFSKLQVLEFASLIGSGAALIGLQRPTLCNGANLSFRREAFERVQGYEGNLHIASGDDEFLMRKINAACKNSIRFVNEVESVVRTKAASSLPPFLQQRFRWAGKWRHNSSWTAKTLAVYVLLLQLSFMAAMAMLFSRDAYLTYTATGVLFFRAIFEFLFLKKVCDFLKIRWRWDVFFVLQIVYPFYVVITGLFSNFMPNTWKGRKL